MTQKYSCAFCDSLHMDKVMDFGDVALAGGFLKKKDFHKERKFPLKVYFCNDCYAVQVVDKVPANVLFQNYFYFSSAINTLREHFATYAKEVSDRFLIPKNSTVVEFGCNDGVLLRPLADQNIKNVIGVDPAKNIVETINDPRINVINDYFTERVSEKIVAEFGHADLVLANNVYAHIPDIQSTTRAIRDVLSDNGVFIFEVHYLGSLIEEMQYDMVYHEHLYYYSLLSAIEHFKKYDMSVFDIKFIPIHAGSIRFYVCKNNSTHSSNISKSVTDLLTEERSRGYDQYATFQKFSNEVNNHKSQLMALLNSIKKSGLKIAGYGASGRANTMIQFCNITEEHLDYIIDDAPAKLGYYTPGSHFKIQSSDCLLSEKSPEYLLVFAWSFIEEIKNRNKNYIKNGGKLIKPLPQIEVLSRTEDLSEEKKTATKLEK